MSEITDIITQFGGTPFLDRLILIGVPGVIAFSLFCYLTGKTVANNVLSVAYIFSASVISYLSGNIILLLLNRFFSAHFVISNIGGIFAESHSDFSISHESLMASLIIAILLSLLSVWVWDRNILFSFANKFQLTHKRNNDAVWDYMFDEYSKILVRDYITGNTYFGGVLRYSDGDAPIRELLLQDVTVWKNSEKYPMEKVYLSRKPSEFSIEFPREFSLKSVNMEGAAQNAGAGYDTNSGNHRLEHQKQSSDVSSSETSGES